MKLLKFGAVCSIIIAVPMVVVGYGMTNAILGRGESV